jgi:hypothetical protein
MKVNRVAEAFANQAAAPEGQPGLDEEDLALDRLDRLDQEPGRSLHLCARAIF